MYSKLLIQDSSYPNILKEIFDAPQALFYEGDLSLLSSNILSIIGTRKPSLYGKAVIDIMLEAIKEENITICSGLAYGIDQLASQKALNIGLKNIIVLAHGLDMTYPAYGHNLRTNIVKAGGLILSEYPIGNKPLKWQFIKRNRIIAGMSKNLLIPEADLNSGSLTTARLALENNRNVLSVPGPITSVSSRGTNWLLSQGATPINNSIDLRRELGLSEKAEANNKASDGSLGLIEQKIIALIRAGIDNTNDIGSYLDKPVSDIMIGLSQLEIAGLIKSDLSGRIIAI